MLHGQYDCLARIESKEIKEGLINQLRSVELETRKEKVWILGIIQGEKVYEAINKRL